MKSVAIMAALVFPTPVMAVMIRWRPNRPEWKGNRSISSARPPERAAIIGFISHGTAPRTSVREEGMNEALEQIAYPMAAHAAIPSSGWVSALGEPATRERTNYGLSEPVFKPTDVNVANHRLNAVQTSSTSCSFRSFSSSVWIALVW